VARFYSNENVPMQVVLELRRLGHDVLTTLDAGKANAAVPDPEVLAFAVAEGRILLSHNRRHFLQIHLHRTAALSTRISRAQARRIDKAVATESDLTNRLIRVQPARLRAACLLSKSDRHQKSSVVIESAKVARGCNGKLHALRPLERQ